MQLVINTYGTYVHVKDDLFEVSLTKEGEKQKHHFASQKVTSILMSKGAALSTDAIILAMKTILTSLSLNMMGYPLAVFGTVDPEVPQKSGSNNLKPV